MSFKTPDLPSVQQAPPPPPMFGERQPMGKKKPKSQQQTFLGSEAAPSPDQLGGKTLLGQ